MRNFPYITTGKILEILKTQYNLSLTRVTFNKLEKKGMFESQKTSGKWRVYTPAEARAIVRIILENYKLIDPNQEIDIKL